MTMTFPASPGVSGRGTYGAGVTGGLVIGLGVGAVVVEVVASGSSGAVSAVVSTTSVASTEPFDVAPSVFDDDPQLASSIAAITSTTAIAALMLRRSRMSRR